MSDALKAVVGILAEAEVDKSQQRLRDASGITPNLTGIGSPCHCPFTPKPRHSPPTEDTESTRADASS